MANTTASNVKNILPYPKTHPYLKDTLKWKVDRLDPNYEEITSYNKNDSQTELKNNAPET
jgi:hypothetical protein